MIDTQIDFHRFDEELKRLELHLEEMCPGTNAILMYGSSTVANWRTDYWCYKQLAPFPIVNTGFGGATAEELLYNYHRLVVPLKPAVMVCYVGANDLCNGYTPENVIDMTHRLFEWCRQDFPGIRFVIIPIKLSPALERIYSTGNVCNRMLTEYSAAFDDTEILDLTSFLFAPDGEHRPEIYLDDMLHHNEKGYIELAGILKPRLKMLLPGKD